MDEVNQKYVQDATALVSILEDIGNVNKMIDLHRNGGEDSMREQYEAIRQRFLDELQEILRSYELNVRIEPLAA